MNKNLDKNRLLIALDLDGTLLTDKKTISARTKKAVQQAIKQGHIVVIATGRPFRSSAEYYHQLGLDTPIVNFNGALVHHPSNPNWDIFHSPLELQTAKQIISSVETFGVRNIMVEVLDDVYLRLHDKIIIDTFVEPDIDVQLLPRILHRDPTSILLHPFEYNVDELRQHLEEEHAEIIEHRKWGAPWNVIEIVKLGLNKAVGLQKICQAYHISQEQVIAFGDEDNDLEMLSYAGTGVAMGNAIASLKEISDQITLTNEEEGIAHFLETQVL